MRQATFPLLLSMVFCSFPARAESYNLRCTSSEGSEAAVLTVRESWALSLMPEVRVLTARPGVTAEATVLAYTGDMLRVQVGAKVEEHEGDATKLEITADRNSGAAVFRLLGPEKQATRAQFQEIISEWKGTCARQQPKILVSAAVAFRAGSR